jgi:creatinine amidohydrolase
MKRSLVFLSFVILAGLQPSFSQAEEASSVLQEMSWVDVQTYLENSDMVIIPLGSTEQHGPHLPLGSDYYQAFAMAEEISKRTQVVVAPVLLVGYSEYHSGFPGTLSIKPETMEQVLFECIESLIGYGFRRFMFFNYHGGNNIVQDKTVHRVNQTTQAIAIAIGVGSPLQEMEEVEFFDWHAGKQETSTMLYLKPHLVRMERAEKPVITFTPQMEELKQLAEEHPELLEVWDRLFGVTSEAKKGGASHDLSSNGIWSLSDPKAATTEMGQKNVEELTETAVRFIEAWRLAKR